MQATVSANRVLAPSRRSDRSVDYPLGIILGLVVPLVAAVVYRTYSLSLSPGWVEITRQLGAPSVLGEIGIIVYAGRQGFDLSDILRRLDRSTRWALALFVGTFWISSVFVAAMASFSTALCLLYLIHLYTGAAVFYLAARGDFTAHRFAPGFALGLAVLALIVILHLSLPPADHGPATWRFGAPIPGFISIRLFGAWSGAVLALLVGLAWTADREDGTPQWLYPAIVLAAATTAWTGTRAALLGVIVALGVVAVIDRGGAAPGFWRKALAALVVGTAVGMVTPLENGAGSMLFRANAMQSADSFASGRLELWTRSLAVATHYPWFGSGMGSSWWLVSLGGFHHVQPHNALVQFLLNWGLVPTVAAVFLIGKAVRQVHRAARGRRDLLALTMMLDCLLTISMLDGMFHFAQFVGLIAILIGACLAQQRSAVAPAGQPFTPLSRASNSRLRSSP